MGTIVVVGSSNTDMTVQVPHIPQPGETVLGGEFYIAGGGKGANQAVAAARAGAEVVFVGRVGEDVFGESAMEQFRKDEIDTSYVVETPGTSSGVALIVVEDTGENAIAVAPGANSRLTPEDVEEAEQEIREAEVLVAQLEVPLQTVARALELARASGTVTILDPAPAQSLPSELLQNVSILTPNESEVGVLTGSRGNGDPQRAAGRLLEAGATQVLVTLGKDGVYVASRESRYYVEAETVEAVDATAAGDVFTGALAAALSESRGMTDAIRFANVAAAISVTRQGAQPSAPRASEIRNRE